jgi:hypothetical protein
MCSVSIALLITPISLGRTTPTPDIQLNSHERKIELALYSTNMDGSAGPTVDEERVAPSTGLWVDSLIDSVVAAGGANASGTAFQDSEISTYFIEGEGFAQADASLGGSDTGSQATTASHVSMGFTLPIDAVYSFSGSYEVLGSGSANANISMFLVGSASDNSSIFIQETASSDLDPPDSIPFFHTGEFKGGTQITLIFAASAVADTASSAGTAEAAFNFRLDIGDRDLDGLIDAWEIDEGIDVDDDGIVDIALPDADPDHKDLFVEYDYLSGYGPPPGALADVVNAFKNAPAASVNNPDGTKGIDIHFIYGKDTIGDSSTWDDDWASFHGIKTAHYGWPGERALPNWDDYKEARLRSHRYLVFANKNTTSNHSGIAELPGDDCIVYVGAFDITQHPTAFRRKIASTTMHELGHTLNLRHGGGTNTNYKPNYISVMNYSFQLPPQWLIDRVGAWKLDYSRDQLITLDEEHINENNALGANGIPHYAGRMTYWNSTPVTSPAGSILFGRGPVDNNKLDFNYLNGNEADVRLDLNHLNSNWDESPDQTLTGHDDWSNIWYRLSGNAAFGAGTPGVGSEVSPEIDVADLIAIGEAAAPCTGDFNVDNDTNGADLGLLLANWGTSTPLYDLNDDGNVDGADLGLFLAAWGGCV